MFPFLCLVLIAPLVASNPLAPLQDGSGIAKYYYPTGSSCGEPISNSSMTCAIDQTYFGTKSSCNGQVQITNVKNNRMVTVTIADDCNSCGENSIDLTIAAFQALQDTPDLPVAELNITWKFVS